MSSARAGAAGIGLLLHQDGRIAAVDAGTAVFFRHGGAEETVLAGLAPDLARDDPVLLPLVVMGRHLVPVLDPDPNLYPFVPANVTDTYTPGTFLNSNFL